MAGGVVRVNLGSSTAISGIRFLPFSSILISASVLVIMVNWVASEPVPLVVGMAAMGGRVPVISFPYQSLMEPPFTATTPMAFMVSMGEPPPTAMRKSHFSWSQTAFPASTILSVGSPVTPAKTAYSTPAPASIS